MDLIFSNTAFKCSPTKIFGLGLPPPHPPLPTHRAPYCPASIPVELPILPPPPPNPQSCSC